MTISGPAMHQQLMDGYKDIQMRMEKMRTNVSSFDAKRGDLSEDRSDALVDLAEHYLPELTREAVQGSWIEVRSAMSGILMRKDDHQRRIQKQLSEINDRRYLQDDRLFEINATLDQASNEQDQLAGKVETALSSDEAFVTLSGQAAVAEAALERAEANLSEIEQDSARKLPGYEQSSLFKYLRDRNYGTEDYKKRGFTRRMDRWLAKFIDFNQAKQGYEFLIKTPDQMRKIIADDRDALDTVMDELEKRRDDLADELGLTAIVKKVDHLQQQRQSQLAELDSIREETESLESELNDLEDTRGSYYREAVTAFRDMLSGLDTRDLASRARRTPSLTDDQIVARIMGVEQQLDSLEHETHRYQDDLQGMKRCMDSLGRMIQRFRASKFDSARSQFSATANVLDDLMRAENEQDIEYVWDKVRKNQRWGPTLGEKLTHVATHPVTQVLVSAMAQAAGAAMSDHARRAGRRRYNQPRYRNSPRSRNAPWFLHGNSGDSSDDHRRSK